MAIKIYRNGSELTNILIQTPYKDTLDKELDQLNLCFKTANDITLKKNDKIRYLRTTQSGNTTITLIDKIFCLYSFVKKKDGIRYTYELNCLSPTKLLDNIIINGMASTDVDGTLQRQLYEVVEKINYQQVIEWQYKGSYASDRHPITINYNEESGQPLRQYWYNDFLWSGQQTVREILNDIASKADKLVIATDYSVNVLTGYITSIDITTISMEKNGVEIASDASSLYHNATIEGVLNENDNVKGYSVNFDSEFANGELVSLIKNAIAKDNLQSAYLPARNDDLTIDDTADWHILTDQPIYSLNKVYVLVGYSATLKYPSTLYGNYLNIGLPVDITNYIVEKSVFDVLPINDQKKRLYFNRGEKGIYGLYKRYKANPLWSNTAIYNILDSLGNLGLDSNTPLKPYFVQANAPLLKGGYQSASDIEWHSLPDTYVDTDGITRNTLDSIYGQNWDGVTAKPLHFENDEERKNFLFSINYQPYADSVVLTEKTTSKFKNAHARNLATLRNQNDRTINAEKYYDSQKSFTNKMGNNEVVVNYLNSDIKAYYDEGQTDYKKALWQLGDYFTIDGTKWVCVAREIENTNDTTIKANFTFSENYNARNLAINENRDKRLYGIPLNQYVDRYIVMRYSTDYYPFDNDPKFLIACYDDFTNNTTTNGYCIKDGIKIGSGDKRDVVVAMKDNYSVDIAKTTYSNTKVNINLRYCERFYGTLENLVVYIATNYNLKLLLSNTYSLGYSRLPFMSSYVNSYTKQLELNHIKKDKMERIILVFKNH